MFGTGQQMRFLITAGGTREYIDPVRFISNASSGKMGFALARAALKAGHKVTLITAPTTERPPTNVKLVKVETASQMFEAVKKYFAKCDCLIMAAAVSDYTPARPVRTKIKRAGKSITLELRPTADILKWAGSHKRRAQIVVGFALEDKQLRQRAEKKLKEKNLDMIVANMPAAIGSERSTVQTKTTESGWLKMPNATKSALAKRIVTEIETLT
ncbi:MAG: phosphopantothenoylcysteine decarboxylase domain-containing protein [Planctomycetota bacterium]|jgi:phosphopantothenoylcysteine decarboxylase/phosphopantothenate--cysteine ligase